MLGQDLIVNSFTTPTFDEITSIFPEPVRDWWLDLNAFIQIRYQAKPKLEYSKCTLQKGWNIKYKKAGKSLCTLYPANDKFITLIVIKTEMIPMIETLSPQVEPYLMEMIKSGRPMNGTLWLMIEVKSQAILANIKELLLLKQAPKE